MSFSWSTVKLQLTGNARNASPINVAWASVDSVSTCMRSGVYQHGKLTSRELPQGDHENIIGIDIGSAAAAKGECKSSNSRRKFACNDMFSFDRTMISRPS